MEARTDTGHARAIPVLLVEDSEIDIQITRRVLLRTPGPIDLQVARDGSEALALLTEAAGNRVAAALPRLVLLDLGLPSVDGWEVLRRLKADTQLCSIPVAVLTGASGDQPLLECLRLGGNMYFVKPLTVADASNVLTAVLQYWDVIAALQKRLRNPGGA